MVCAISSDIKEIQFRLTAFIMAVTGITISLPFTTVFSQVYKNKSRPFLGNSAKFGIQISPTRSNIIFPLQEYEVDAVLEPSCSISDNKRFLRYIYSHTILQWFSSFQPLGLNRDDLFSHQLPNTT